MDEPANNAPATRRRPRWVLCDVNETLLDLQPLKVSISRALGGRSELVSLWFTTLLHYSLVASALGRYRDFTALAGVALSAVAHGDGVEVSAPQIAEALAPLAELPPHPDVIPALRRLNEAGIGLAALSNSSAQLLAAQLDHAALAPLFAAQFSVERVGRYKPHPEPYLAAVRSLNIAPGEALLVAAHGWDIAGARAAGLRAIFVARPGKELYRDGEPPEAIVHDFTELADVLVNLPAA